MTKQEISFYDKEQTDALLGAKANTSDLSTVAFTGDYDDLTDKPTIPAAQVNSDWNATTGVAEILNKPDLSKYLEKVTKEGGYWAYGLVGAVQTMIMAAYEDYGDTFCLRGSSSHTFQVGTPTDPKHPATKQYVDDKFVAQTTHPGQGIYLYANTSVQAQIPCQYEKTGSTAMYRNANGQSQINDPTDQYHVANKRYVDNAIAGITGTITVTDNTDYITINY